MRGSYRVDYYCRNCGHWFSVHVKLGFPVPRFVRCCRCGCSVERWVTWPSPMLPPFPKPLDPWPPVNPWWPPKLWPHPLDPRRI